MSASEAKRLDRRERSTSRSPNPPKGDVGLEASLLILGIASAGITGRALSSSWSKGSGLKGSCVGDASGSSKLLDVVVADLKVVAGDAFAVLFRLSNAMVGVFGVATCVGDRGLSTGKTESLGGDGFFRAGGGPFLAALSGLGSVSMPLPLCVKSVWGESPSMSPGSGGETGLFINIAVSGVSGKFIESDVDARNSLDVSIAGMGGRSEVPSDFFLLLAIVEAFDFFLRLAIVEALELARESERVRGRLGPFDFGRMNRGLDRVVLAVEGRG